MSALLLAVCGASLLGSLHCLGMCGGLIALWAGRQGSGRQGCSPFRSHLGYHLGRAASYGAVGLVAGSAGGLLDRVSGGLLGLQRTGAILAGGLVLLWGLAVTLGELGALRALPHATPLAGALGRLAGRAHRALDGLPPARQALLTGLLTPLLPCGWLWLFALTAAGSGGALPGAAVMLSFWVGTVPPLLIGGLGLSALAARLRPRVRLLGGLALVLVGGLALCGRGSAIVALPRLLRPAPAAEPATTPAAPGSGAPASALPALEEPPCCCHEERT